MATRTPLHCRTFIANDFRPGTGGLERRNPATDELVAVADVADAETVDAAVSAARAAFATWGTTTGFERGHLLRELARVALERLDDLATSMTLEMGKPLDEARGEVRKFAQAMRFYAEEAERIGGETIPNESNDFLSVVRKEPVGVVAAITPWNYPVELIGWKLGGALGAGCTVVVKPSEYTPGAAQLLAECIRDAGFPPGVVNVVLRRGRGRRHAHGASRDRQDRLHGLQCDGAAALQDGVRRDPADARAGRQLPDAGLAPRRPRPGRGRRGPPVVPQRGPDLHRDQPDLRRARGQRRVRRPGRGAHARPHGRRRLREPGRRRRAGDDGGDPRPHHGARRRRPRARRERRRRRRSHTPRAGCS